MKNLKLKLFRDSPSRSESQRTLSTVSKDVPRLGILRDCPFQEYRRGFTLVETLITVSLIAILSGVSLMGYRGQINKANDGKRKDDLGKLKVVLEDYYSDNNCYPTVTEMPSCGESFLPYLNQMFCEPGGRESYLYVPEETDCPQYYRIFTQLKNNEDPAIAQAGCSTGCGPPESPMAYNWGVSSSNVNLAMPCESYSSCFETICNSIPGPETCSNAYFCGLDCGGGLKCEDEEGQPIASKQCN